MTPSAWTTLGGLLVVVVTIGAAPSAYLDQRQNGELNVRAHLDNFIVVLIPTSNLGGSLSWLDFTKRLNLQNHLKYVRDDKPKDQEKSSSVREEDDEHRVAAPVILEKTPYTVDVEIKSKSSPLSRLHPQPVIDISSDVMIALSPSVSLSKTAESAQETSKPPVKKPQAPEVATESPEHSVNVPRAPEKADEVHEAAVGSPSLPEKAPKAPERATEAAFHPPEVKPLEEPARMVKKSKSILSTTLDRVQKAPKAAEGEKTIQDEKDLRLRLLGAGIEVCASHERRGDDGNCEPIKARRRSGQYFAPSGLLPSLRFGLSPANE